MRTEVTPTAPAAWTRAQKVFNAMREEAVDNVWSGFLTKKFGELGISNPYYGPTMFVLQEMGAVAQIHRGYANSLSRWHIMVDELDYNEFLEVQPMIHGKDNRDKIATRLRIVERELKDLQKFVYDNLPRRPV